MHVISLPVTKNTNIYALISPSVNQLSPTASSPDFDLLTDSLVGLHVEALQSDGTINFGDECRMEGHDHNGVHKDATWFKRSDARHAARVEWQLKLTRAAIARAGHLAMWDYGNSEEINCIYSNYAKYYIRR